MVIRVSWSWQWVVLSVLGWLECETCYIVTCLRFWTDLTRLRLWVLLWLLWATGQLTMSGSLACSNVTVCYLLVTSY